MSIEENRIAMRKYINDIRKDTVDELKTKIISHIHETRPLTIQEIIKIIEWEADTMKGLMNKGKQNNE